MTINVLANDFVPAGTLVPSTVTIVTAPASGSAVANADGTITYTPGATVGNNTFTYTVANTSGDVSNAATVTVFVHEPPVAVNDSALARSDRSATIAVLANDFDTDGTLDPTTVTIVSAPSSGTAVVNGNGTITFTPGNVLGNVTFTYTVKDDVGAVSNAATVTVFVDAPPVAVNDSALTPVSSPVTIAVLGNDHDADGTLDPTTVTVATPPSSGSALVNQNGTITYTPGSATGNVTFTYTVEDNLGVVSNAATVTVFVDAPPATHDDSALARSDTPVTINVLANDTDPLGTIDPSTVTVVTPPSSGQAVANPDGTITYTPGAVLGNVTFTYTVEDNLGIAGNTATVTVFVDAPPVAVNDSALAITGKAVTISVLANDHDIDGTLDPGTVTIVSPPSSGSAAVNNNGAITFTPGATLGNVTFTYMVEDNLGVVSNEATVTVFVDAPPVAINNWVMTRSDTPVTIIVLGNDQDTGGTFDPTSVTIVSPPASGHAVANADGTITYTPGTAPGQQHVHLHGQGHARGRLQCGDGYRLRQLPAACGQRLGDDHPRQGHHHKRARQRLRRRRLALPGHREDCQSARQRPGRRQYERHDHLHARLRRWATTRSPIPSWTTSARFPTRPPSRCSSTRLRPRSTTAPSRPPARR